MDLSVILEAISTVGFPIVIALGCFIFIYKIWTKEQEEQKTREDKMFEQLEGFKQTMDNFNVTLSKIDTRLEVLEHQTK